MSVRNSSIYLGIVFIVILTASLFSASAFPQNAADIPAGGNNVLNSGANVVIVQHLMEIDQIANPGYLKVFETIVYKNIGTQNYTGPIYSWVDENAFSISILKMEMAENVQSRQLPIFQVNSNVIGWNNTIPASISHMYRISYMVPAEPAGKLSESAAFTKKLKYPTIVNYEYVQIRNMPLIVIKLTASDDMKTAITDGEGTRLKADSVEAFEGSNTYNWVLAPSDEIRIKISRLNLGGNDFLVYLLIILVVIGVVSYPFLRNRSPLLKRFEEKVGRFIPVKRDEDIYQEEDEEEDEEGSAEDETDAESEIQEHAGSTPQVLEFHDIEKMSPDELKAAESALSKVLKALEKDYAEGTIPEKEYNNIRDRYEKLAADIKNQADKA